MGREMQLELHLHCTALQCILGVYNTNICTNFMLEAAIDIHKYIRQSEGSDQIFGLYEPR